MFLLPSLTNAFNDIPTCHLGLKYALFPPTYKRLNALGFRVEAHSRHARYLPRTETKLTTLIYDYK